MQEVCDFIKECGTYYLATIDGDQARVRPFGTIHIFDGKLYIQTGKVKPVYKQLIANPKAELCCFKDGTWLRLAGKLIPDENDDNCIVFYFEDATASFASFGGEPKEIKF